MSNLFRKIFEGKGRKKTESLYDKYRSELQSEGLSSYEDLKGLVKPLIRKATKVIIEKPSSLSDNSQLHSHVGGQPYFEKEEEWPTTESGKKLDFIFQIFNENLDGLPQDIQLIQFYYDFEAFPWDAKSDACLVKTYKEIRADEMKLIARPSELEKATYCKLRFEQIDSLPDWTGLYPISSQAKNLSFVLNEHSPWEAYEKLCAELIGKQENQNQIGGYPIWIQGENTPRNSENDPLDLLLQIESDDHAEIMWGDQGTIYFFRDEERASINFKIQSY